MPYPFSLSTLTVAFTLCSLLQGTVAANASAAPGSTAPSQQQSVRDLAIQRADEHIRRGLDLGGRHAICSAQLQFAKAVRQIAIALDMEQASDAHQQALDAGLRILSGVEAPKAADSASLATMQQQLLTAQERLAFAGGQVPTASMALYSLGRSYIALAEESEEERRTAGPKAMTLYRAALAVDSANYLAANELAVLLVRYGQLEDAERVLTQSLSVAQRPELWRNLSVVYQRQGQTSLAQQAQKRHDELAVAKGRAPATSLAATIRWTEPKDFNGNSGRDDFDAPAAAKKTETAQPQETVTKAAPKKESRFSIPDWIAGKFGGANEETKR